MPKIISFIKNTSSKLIERKFNASFLYFTFYSVFFVPMIGGVGNYWDWTFPYYSNQIGSFFSNYSASWSSVGIGSPLSYASDYFFRLVILLFYFIQPEYILFFILVIAFSIGSIFVYKILKDRGLILAFLGGLVAFINPAIFYKLVAGHIYYIISYAILVGLIYFLLNIYNKRYIDIAVVSLLLAFIGLQIQFFFYGFIVLVLYFLVYKDKFSWIGLISPFLATVLINLVWLMNFFSGASNVSQVSSQALKNTFAELVNSSIFAIVKLSFSSGTLIERYYNNYILLSFICLSILGVILVLYKRKETKSTQLFVVAMIVFFLLALRGSLVFSFYPLSILAPMFREVGHMGPIFFFFLIISIILLSRNIIRDKLIILLIAIFISVNGYMYIQNYPSVDFSVARNKFEYFNHFMIEDTSQYRVLSYPFFGQYSFQDIPTRESGGLPINNSGYDSFAKYARKSFIDNNVPPHEFKESLQYNLLTTLEIDKLRMLNVKYIFDFSDIYESNYNDYVPADIYNNDISIIKNNDQFLPSLLEKNIDSIDKVSKYIYEIKNFNSYIHVFDRLYFLDEKSKEDILNKVDINDFYYTTENKIDAIYLVHLDLSNLYENPLKLEHKMQNVYVVRKDIPNETIKAIYSKLGVMHKPEDISFDVLLRQPLVVLTQPKRVTFENISTVKKTVRIEGATTSFYLAMSESYHNKWRLQFNNQSRISDEAHVVLNDSLNAWFVDIDEFCIQRFVCTVNNDGSYDLDMTIIFSPQRWFVIGRSISFICILLLLSYIVRYNCKRNEDI